MKSSKQRRNLGIPSHGIESRKVVDVDSQSDRVIDMAASIILNDIRMTVYDCEQYERTTGNNRKWRQIYTQFSKAKVSMAQDAEVDPEGAGPTISWTGLVCQ